MLTKHHDLTKINRKYSNFKSFLSYVESKLNERDERLVNRKEMKKYSGEAAVLLTLATKKNSNEYSCLEDTYIILQKRSSVMEHNPGDMAFPGGSEENNDNNSKDTAFREAWEELGFEPKKLDFIGYLDEYVSSSNKVVRLVIAGLEEEDMSNGEGFREYLEEKYRPKNKESQNTVVVPLSHFLEPDNYYSLPYNIESSDPNKHRGFIRYFGIDQYLPKTSVWGLTATMIRRFLDLVFEEHSLPIEITNIPLDNRMD
jgi:8-oxo-dGTP pyrophosphatase MutT (NUDIX family)